MRGFRLCAWPLLAVAVVLAVASVYYTVTHLTIRTSRNDLVASNQRLVQQSEKMDRAFGGRDGMVVVVENGHPKRAIKFANDLAAELRRYPDHFPELFYHIDPERLKRSALLYLDPQDLDKIKDSLLKQQDLLSGLAADPSLTTFYRLVNDRIARAMIGEVFTGFLADQEKPELPDLSLLNTSLRGLSASLEGNQPQDSLFSSFFPKELNDLEGAGYFFTENDKFLLFLVTPKGDGYASRSQDLALLRKTVDQVKARYPGLEAGVTGPDALEADEMSSSMQDVTLATWLSLAGQLGLLILFLRSLRRTLVEGLVLVLGLCWTFGLVTLVVGHLNLLSLIFAPLMLGLTVDYGIHWFCRLEEEEGAAGHRSAEVLTRTLRRSAPGIVYAGVAAVVSFVPLAFVGFKGLAELGLILAMGILVMLVATLLLVPALVTITEKFSSSAGARGLSASPHAVFAPALAPARPAGRPGVVDHRPGRPQPALRALRFKSPASAESLGRIGGVGIQADPGFQIFHLLRRPGHRLPGGVGGPVRGPETPAHGVSRGIDPLLSAPAGGGQASDPGPNAAGPQCHQLPPGPGGTG